MRRIAAYSLFILGFLTVTFFRHYSGAIIPYPFLFWLVGITMFWGGYLLLRNTPSTRDATKIRQHRQIINELKMNGEKIRVDFRICEIKENNYSEQKDPDDDPANISLRPNLFHALNEMGDNKGSSEIPIVNQTVIVYPYDNRRTGRTERFISGVIPKDRITLSFYLDKQQQTTLYVDKANRKLYYFDLDFLNAG